MPTGVYIRTKLSHRLRKHFKHTNEAKEKIRNARKGIKLSEKTKWKMSEFAKKVGRRISFKGRRHTEEAKRKISEAVRERGFFSIWNKTHPRKKENHHNWLGGKSFEPYGLEFNKDLKEVIRNRDRRKCFICEKIELEIRKQLSVHHVDYNKKNNNPNNLISLCRNCHSRTNYKREYWIDYFKEYGIGTKIQ